MTPLTRLLTIGCFFVSLTALFPVSSDAKEPSPESLEKLLEVSQAQNLNSVQITRMGNTLDMMIGEAANKFKLTPEQVAELKKRLPELSKDLQKIVREEMGWPKVKESYARIYARNFSQDEVNDLIAFYQSPTGRVFLKKNAQLTEDLSQASLERLPAVQERIQKSTSEMLKKLIAPTKK